MGLISTMEDSILKLSEPLSPGTFLVEGKDTEYGSKTTSGNARVFNCDQCHRAFTREEHLTRHTLLTHNRLKPFVCGICSRPFSRRDLLLRHAKNLHEGSELAATRIRKLYKRHPNNMSPEANTNSICQHSSSKGKLLKTKPASVNILPLKKKEYETPEGAKFKMSVSMLVS